MRISVLRARRSGVGRCAAPLARSDTRGGLPTGWARPTLAATRRSRPRCRRKPTGSKVRRPTWQHIFAGTLHRQGRLSGRLSAQVADLSQLLPAPVVGASAEGTIALGRGPAQADLAVTVGGVGAAAHLLTDAAGSAPVLSLTMGRLDLDPWQSAWTQRASARHARQTLRPDWPVKIDLTISAVGLRGGLARGVHAVLDFDGSMLRLSGSATLPGEAAVSLSASVTNAVPGLALAGEWDAGSARVAHHVGVARSVRIAHPVQGAPERAPPGRAGRPCDGQPRSCRAERAHWHP